MMNKKQLQNIFRSRYFYVITLLSVWLLVQVFYFNVEKAPSSSLQLSSSTTSAVPGLVASVPAANASSDIQKYYDVQFKLLQDQIVSVVGGDYENTTLKNVTLKKNSVVTVSVPHSVFGGVTDPTVLKPKQVNLNSIISSLDVVKDEPPYKGRQEATITSTNKKNKNLIGETVRLSLSALASSARLSVIKIEEGEESEIDEEDEVANIESPATNTPLVIDSTTQGGVTPCAVGAPGCPKNTMDIVDWAKSFLPKQKTIEEIVVDYEKSASVQELMNLTKSGYSVNTTDSMIPACRKLKRITVRDGKVSRSCALCYRGTKNLLGKWGEVDLTGKSAKMAAAQLDDLGFINLTKTDYAKKMTSPLDAPKGSIIVYEGYKCRAKDKGCKHGHIEVRTENGLMSDYFSPNPRTGLAMEGRGRRVLGIYIKSDTSILNSFALDNKTKGTKDEKAN